MKAINPYFNFNGDTEEAFEFYRSIFGGDFSVVVRFKDLDDVNVAGEDQDLIAHISLPIGSYTVLMGTDTLESMGQQLTVGNNVSITIAAESAEEAAELYDALSNGGKVEMPLEETDWAEKFGHCIDRFGIQWMIDYAGTKQYESLPERVETA